MSQLNCRIGKVTKKVVLKSQHLTFEMMVKNPWNRTPDDPVREWALKKMMEEKCQQFINKLKQ